MSPDPLSEAAQRMDSEEAAKKKRAAAAAAGPPTSRTPDADLEVTALISSFLKKVPPDTAGELVRRWKADRHETHWPPAGILRKRRKRLVPQLIEAWETEVVGHGWFLDSYGKRVELRSSDGEGTPAVLSRHTVAITADGGMLLAVRVGGDVVVEGDAGLKQGRPSLRVGPLHAAREVTWDLNSLFPQRGPVVGKRVVENRFSYIEEPEYDPNFDVRSVHLQALAEAMVHTLRALGVQ